MAHIKFRNYLKQEIKLKVEMSETLVNIELYPSEPESDDTHISEHMAVIMMPFGRKIYIVPCGES